MATIIIDSYDITKDKENRILFDKVSYYAQRNNKFIFLQRKPSQKKSEVHGESILADKIRYMEQTSPFDFLRIKQNNTQPAPADMKIVDDLSKNFGLNNGVINVLVDFVLIKKDNKLVRNYAEKLAASLARERIETAIDAMNYLNRSANSFNSKQTKSKDNDTDEVEDKISDDELEKLLQEFDK